MCVIDSFQVFDLVHVMTSGAHEFHGGYGAISVQASLWAFPHGLCFSHRVGNFSLSIHRYIGAVEGFWIRRCWRIWGSTLEGAVAESIRFGRPS